MSKDLTQSQKDLLLEELSWCILNIESLTNQRNALLDQLNATKDSILRFKQRHEAADRTLAFAEKLTVLPPMGERKVAAIPAELLGILTDPSFAADLEAYIALKEKGLAPEGGSL
jgi:hypothetical protein